MRSLDPSALAVLRLIAEQEAGPCVDDVLLHDDIDYEYPPVVEVLVARKLVREYACGICSRLRGEHESHYQPTDLGKAALLIGHTQ